MRRSRVRFPPWAPLRQFHVLSILGTQRTVYRREFHCHKLVLARNVFKLSELAIQTKSTGSIGNPILSQHPVSAVELLKVVLVGGVVVELETRPNLAITRKGMSILDYDKYRYG